MFDFKILVRKFCPKNRLATTAVTTLKITALNHEIIDNTVENRVGVCVIELVSAVRNGNKILNSFRCCLAEHS